jgi:hypothetical protein
MHSVILPAFLSFTTPAMWAGAVLAALPVAAHLLNRYARARRVFPSLWLLQQSVAHQARIARLRRWILLALRCLFVAAVAAAFARPVWHHSRREALAAARGNAVVLLLDTSASMRVTRAGVPLIDIAKSEGGRILSDLRRGTDVASLVLVDASARAVFDELSPNLPALQAELQRQTATEQRADIAAGLRLAGQLLSQFRGPRRLVVLSDGQAVSWHSLLESRPKALLPVDTDVTVIDLQPPAARNVSIQIPRHDPSQPLVGQTVSLSAQLHNHTDQQRQVRVTAQADQQSLPPVQVTLEPGQRRDVSFETTWDRVGHHEIVFQADHDDFDVDDQCYWVAHTRPGIPVAVVSDDDPARLGSASHYLALALAPYKDRNDRFAVQLLSSRDLPTAQLDEFSTVFVGYLGLLERPAAERLLQYVQQGGACVIFCGQGPVQRNLLQLDELRPNGCLPWVPGPRQDLFRQGRSVRISGGSWRARLLRDFDATSQIALGSIQFGSIWSVPQVRGEAEVLLSFEGGVPALASRAVDRGRMVLANCSPDTESSDLGKHGLFVALVQVLAQNLRSTDTLADRLYVGHSLRYEFAPEAPVTDVELVEPGGQSLASRISVDGTASRLQVSNTSRAGLYRVRRSGRDLDAVAVNLDPTESDLRTVDVQRLRQAFSGPTTASPSDPSGGWQKPIDLHGRPLWGWMMLAAMAMMGAELSLLGRWRR